MPKSLSENLELLRHTSVKIDITFTKRYNNSILLLMRLSRAERIFLDFITEEMDDNNYITNSFQIRNKFNALLKKVGQDQYAENTIHKTFKNLVETHLLKNCIGRGLYQVNPLFFFKGTEEDRQKCIRKNLEELNRLPINKFRQDLIIQTTTALIQEFPED